MKKLETMVLTRVASYMPLGKVIVMEGNQTGYRHFLFILPEGAVSRTPFMTGNRVGYAETTTNAGPASVFLNPILSVSEGSFPAT